MSDQGTLVRATIRLLPTAENGRTAPIRGSYRPNHNFFGPDNRSMGTGFVDLPEGVEVRPGESVECNIQFWEWARLKGEIYPGREWRIQEGGKLVGFGTVLGVLENSDK